MKVNKVTAVYQKILCFMMSLETAHIWFPEAVELSLRYT